MYIIKGIVHPERAPISLGPLKFSIHHPTTKNNAEINFNIVLNQITLLIDTSNEWNIYDLKNMAKQLVADHLAIIGFIKGYAYEVEIRQILNPEKEIDQVYGIDIPCIEKRNKKMKISHDFPKIMAHIQGELGLYVKRCLNDLIASMKYPDDTGFYCYRAIESLKQYCKEKFNISKEADQWKKFREITGYKKDDIDIVKNFADPVRHGDVINMTSENREKIFLKTWDIIEGFFDNIEKATDIFQNS